MASERDISAARSGSATAREKELTKYAAGAAAKAGLASRHNTLFSIPMLFLMGAASHLPSQVNPEYNGFKLAAVIVLILAALELNAIKGKTDNLKITSIMGVTHIGIVLTAIIYVAIEVLTK